MLELLHADTLLSRDLRHVDEAGSVSAVFLATGRSSLLGVMGRQVFDDLLLVVLRYRSAKHFDHLGDFGLPARLTSLESAASSLKS